MSNALIIARVDRELAPKGFSRKKATWNRQKGPLVEVVDIQTSKGGDAVTMNAGVLSRSIYFTCWGREAESFIQEPECTVRVRVGRLIDNKDRWWDVGGAGVAEELAGCVGVQILPFLERMQSLEAMRDWLADTGMASHKTPLSSICFAVLQYQLGSLDAACVTLAELERKALGAWKARAQEVAVRIGCGGGGNS